MCIPDYSIANSSNQAAFWHDEGNTIGAGAGLGKLSKIRGRSGHHQLISCITLTETAQFVLH
jgi:hypothetical protein